ncbi:MAG: AraC family transcriptional regulator [Planctomycetota bacterium]
MADQIDRDNQKFQATFFAENPDVRAVFGLFEHLPSALFYAKDARHRYVGVNQRTLCDVFGLEDASELLGRTDHEFQPPALAEAYHAEDRRVMDGGEVIANQVWLVPHVNGTPSWYISTKTPLTNPWGDVIGLAGVMYPVVSQDEHQEFFQELWPAIEYMDDHYTESIVMSEMAEMTNLSATQFNSRFRTILRLSPTQYLLSRRIHHAQQLLSQTELSISDVAARVGFFDQSHFTKRFRRMTGLTPLQYRKRFR